MSSVQEITELSATATAKEDAGSQEVLLLACMRLVTEIDRVLYSPNLEKRRSQLRNISISLWKKSIYPLLQRALSATDYSPVLQVLTPSLVGLMKALDLSGIEDPLLLGALGVLVRYEDLLID
tara:strand:- start:8 stop:376 length:369 start_codon:yes stop_codon:yes gene_type:complete